MKFYASLFPAVLALVLSAADERPIVPPNCNISVRYMLSSDGRNWSSGSMSIRNAVSESMMENEAARRFPGRQVRILSASAEGKTVRCNVQYQVSRDGKSWSTGTASLSNALTESMAKNQVIRSHPGMMVRILSMTPR